MSLVPSISAEALLNYFGGGGERRYWVGERITRLLKTQVSGGACEMLLTNFLFLIKDLVIPGGRPGTFTICAEPMARSTSIYYLWKIELFLSLLFPRMLPIRLL